jgi:hypothetical protein
LFLLAYLFVCVIGAALYFFGYPLKINISTKQNNVLQVRLIQKV